MLGGQRPHVDFHTDKGPIFCLYSAFAMVAGAGNLSAGFGIARGLVTAALTVWCFVLLRNRIVPAAAIVLCVLIALLAGAPFPLSSSPFAQSMAMIYNRFGYAPLAPVVPESFPARSVSGAASSTGIAVGLMLFLKFSFMGASLGVLALSFVVRRPRWIRNSRYLHHFAFPTP